MLRDVLLHRIEAGGPMPFEEFMAACLYDPDHGFFATGPLRSTKAGDFLTSPEVSGWFGRIIARYVTATDPGGAIIEVGAGSGTLLRPLLAELDTAPETVVAIDASPAAQRALREVPGVDAVLGDLSEVGAGIRGTILANELLDNLPVAIVVRTGRGWEERWVGAEDGALCLVAAPVRPDVAAWAEAYAGSVPDGGLVEVQLTAGAWIASALSKLASGALLVFDYGGTAEELESRRTLGTLRTYRNHHLGPEPLLAPGETDVTVDVNFTAMLAVAEQAGAEVTLWRQDDFLTAWGLRDEVALLRRRERALAGDGDAMARLTLRSEATDAETLLHPRGLGDFRVLVAEKRPAQ